MKELRLPDTAINEINLLVEEVKQELLNPSNVYYFDILPGQPHKEQLTTSNLEKLRQVATKPGLYALWVQNDVTTTYQYIGHTAGKTAQTRLMNHFFKKHPQTGSQLHNVETAVKEGNKVGFTYVALQPPLIRLYVEAALIDRHNDCCFWNIQGKRSRKPPLTDLNS